LKLNCSSSWNTKPNSKKKTFKVYVWMCYLGSNRHWTKITIDKLNNNIMVTRNKQKEGRN
jgi:hypothetical protein